jgi:uncharacterized protein YmfQ (DUF2313 family)
MPAPIYDRTAYLHAFQRLLPRGAAWPRDGDAVQTKVFAGLMVSYERQHAACNGLLVDGFPASTEQLLPEWESTVGLPDPCAGESPSFQQRRAQVVARFAGRGGQSAAYFIGYAANVGFAISITQYAPARFGRSTFGTPYYGREWAHVWTINAPLETVVTATFGGSLFGDPYRAWSNAVLECEMTAIKPAQTHLLFHYA